MLSDVHRIGAGAKSVAGWQRQQRRAEKIMAADKRHPAALLEKTQKRKNN